VPCYSNEKDNMKIPTFIFLIITFFFSSCSKEKTEPPGQKEMEVITEPKEIDACSLIGKDAVEKIFDVEMKEPKQGRSQEGGPNKAAFSECSFESDTEGTKIFLSIYVRFTPFPDENHTTIQTVRSSFKNSGIEVKNIDGAGDVAFWGGNQLHVFMGDNYYLIITLIGLKERDETITKAKAVALSVIQKLNSV
jgi:hypothetical protein